MGKLHHIKRSFNKVVTQKPWETMSPGSVKGYYLAANRIIGLTYINIGVRYDGSWYIGHYGESYKGLMRKLIREYEAGGSTLR